MRIWASCRCPLRRRKLVRMNVLICLSWVIADVKENCLSFKEKNGEDETTTAHNKSIQCCLSCYIFYRIFHEAESFLFWKSLTSPLAVSTLSISKSVVNISYFSLLLCNIKRDALPKKRQNNFLRSRSFSLLARSRNIFQKLWLLLLKVIQFVLHMNICMRFYYKKLNPWHYIKFYVEIKGNVKKYNRQISTFQTHAPYEIWNIAEHCLGGAFLIHSIVCLELIRHNVESSDSLYDQQGLPHFPRKKKH